MTSTNSLSLILRRLNEVESKLDRMMEELRTLKALICAGSSKDRLSRRTCWWKTCSSRVLD